MAHLTIKKWLALTATAALALLAVPATAATAGASTETLGVDLATTAGPMTGVGDLYTGTAHWNSTAGSTATLSFSGTGAVVYGVKDVDQGIATYSVDGGSARSVDDYSSTRIPGTSLFAVSGLASGSHTITITVTGSKNAASTNDVIALDSATVF